MRPRSSCHADAESAGVAIDPEAFDAVVQHVLNNAIEASEARAPVHVRLRHEALSVVVDIVDEGPGMTPEFIRDELFRPFCHDQRRWPWHRCLSGARAAARGRRRPAGFEPQAWWARRCACCFPRSALPSPIWRRCRPDGHTMPAKPKLLIVEDDEGLCSQYRWAFPACEVLMAQRRPQAVAHGAEGAAARGHHRPRPAAGSGRRQRGLRDCSRKCCASRRRPRSSWSPATASARTR